MSLNRRVLRTIQKKKRSFNDCRTAVIGECLAHHRKWGPALRFPVEERSQFPKVRNSMYFKKLALVLFFLAAIGVSAASAATCTLASMDGTYGFLTNGFDGSYPAVSGGQAIADGKGNLSGSFNYSVGGEQFDFAFTGSYTMEKNCTGTLTYTADSDTIHFNFVMDDTSKGMQLARTDAGYIFTGYAIPQGTETCGLSGKSSTFAFNLFGGLSGTGTVAYTGQLVLNGKGALTGTETLNLDGTITSGVSLTGSYTQNSNCLGTLQTVASGHATQNFVTIAVGKELLLVETDSGSIVGGTMQ
jgi:hypothetical protein